MSTSHPVEDPTPTTPGSFSRRGFMKRITQMGAALGLGITGMMATAKPAHACTPYYDDYKYEFGSCGSCTEGGVNKRVRRRYHRVCRDCVGGVRQCTAWELIGRACVQCA